MKKLSLILAGLLVLLMAIPAAATPPGTSKMSKGDRELLAQAQVEGKGTVTVLIATANRSTKSVADGIMKLGGTVRYRDDDLGYVRANVPVGAVEAVAKLSGIEGFELDRVIPLEDPRPEATGDELMVDPPGAGTPALNPYMPSQDIGAPQFVAANPTWDGRGVVIGIMDTGVDLAHPALQNAMMLNGTSVPKIKDWVTSTDPVADGDPTWINMAAQVTATGGTFTYAGATYTAPANGTYRVAVFKESSLGALSEYGNGVRADLDRDGAGDGVFAVLWNTDTNSVWVDTNKDGSFADEQGMTDFRVNRDIGYFGTDNLATAVEERVPFVIQTDGKNKYVNIGIVSGSHGTHVAGIAAGNGFFDGAFNGGAPNAQIVSARACLFVAGCTSHALVEGMIWLAKQANVDVINMSIGGLPALNDGNNTRAIIYNRLIEQYNVQMFISAGNSGPGANTVGDPSVATQVMSVGSYITSDTWMANYGSAASQPEALHVYSSRGPREDGGFKPNIIAPGAAVSSVPMWQNGQPVPGTYALPPGYGMYNGTSMASPQAAGGAALLISAAKQAGAQYKPDQFRKAINSSARYIDNLGAHEQGHGLLNVSAAWDLLKLNLKTVEISSSAPVKTVISQYLATPYTGAGIYEREGWAPGQTGTRTITFTRTSGGGKEGTYNLAWVGNDGTFSSDSTISLALNKPVTLSVTINEVAAGVNSAILTLDDPSTPGIEYAVMNTIIAAYQFNADNNFTVSVPGAALRPDKDTVFFYVPPNTPAFKVDVTGISGRVRVLRFHPYGVPFDSTNNTPYQTGGSISRIASNPMSGVWEVTVDNSRAGVTDPATFTVTGSILGVDIDPATWTEDPVQIGTEYSKEFSFTNRFGTFTGGASGTTLGSAQAVRPTIAAGGPQQIFWIEVPAGSTSISARIGNPSDNAADLDIFLFDCTGTECVQRASSAGGSSDEFVSRAGPAAGMWAVLVDPYAVPSGSTAYDYVDVIAHSMYGSVSITDPAAVHENGATWSATTAVTANAAPAAGRFLQGFVQVKSGSAVLGSAEVRLMNVTE